MYQYKVNMTEMYWIFVVTWQHCASRQQGTLLLWRRRWKCLRGNWRTATLDWTVMKSEPTIMKLDWRVMTLGWKIWRPNLLCVVSRNSQICVFKDTGAWVDNSNINKHFEVINLLSEMHWSHFALFKYFQSLSWVVFHGSYFIKYSILGLFSIINIHCISWKLFLRLFSKIAIAAPGLKYSILELF